MERETNIGLQEHIAQLKEQQQSAPVSPPVPTREIPVHLMPQGEWDFIMGLGPSAAPARMPTAQEVMMHDPLLGLGMLAFGLITNVAEATLREGVNQSPLAAYW